MQNRVRELRTAAGLTQQQLAEQVRVSSRTIISLEKGQYNPSLLLAYRIAVLFGVTVRNYTAWKKICVWRKKNMKIYHKKNFSEDILLTGLGLLLLVTMLLRQCFRPKSVLICTAALLLGLGLLFRSLSQAVRPGRTVWRSWTSGTSSSSCAAKVWPSPSCRTPCWSSVCSVRQAGCCVPVTGRPSWYSAGCWSCPGCSGSSHF